MPANSKLTRAAQYVRMSTDLQVYSTTNQIDAIGRYAAANGFEVVRTYADEGRSGLNLKGRASLQQLLADVLAPDPGFDAILVYDVSRWGRFQDADESAYYEFLCRSAGVPIHYCAEAFKNDGSISATLLKGLKRVMAGEYSRELSAKTWAGQSRLVSLGFKMGGKPGYGLRRLLVDRDGNPKQLLQHGEHKSITTDRVVLVPGPPDEVANVRYIFELAKQGWNYQAIADALNAKSIVPPIAQRWCNGTIRSIVQAERYIGVNLYNKRSMKLGAGFRYNPEGEWVRCKDAFEPLISVETFNAVQAQQRYSRPQYTDEQLLAQLRRVLAEYGYLTKELINSRSPPAARTYKKRFGSLRNAYARAGYDPYAREKFGPESDKVDDFINEISVALGSAGHRTNTTSIARLITVDGRLILAPRLYNMRSGNIWRARFTPSPDVDLVIAGLMDGENRAGIYVLPIEKFRRSKPVDIRRGADRWAPYQLWDFSYLSEMITRLA